MKLHYSQAGPQQGTPIIVMHGLYGSLSNLGMVARPLAQQGYAVISVDLRNHGLSPHASSMTYREMAQDIIALMDDLGVAQAHLLGHSMGGKVAMEVALNHPRRVNKLIVADIAPVTYGTDRHGGILQGLQALAASELHSRQQADAILADYESNPGIRSFLLKNLYRLPDGRFGLRLNLDAILANYDEVLTQAPQGQPFDGEVLFLKGEQSAYIQDKHRDEILRLFPRAQLKVIAATGHWLHAEKPELVTRLCLKFLQDSP